MSRRLSSRRDARRTPSKRFRDRDRSARRRARSSLDDDHRRVYIDKKRRSQIVSSRRRNAGLQATSSNSRDRRRKDKPHVQDSLVAALTSLPKETAQLLTTLASSANNTDLLSTICNVAMALNDGKKEASSSGNNRRSSVSRGDLKTEKCLSSSSKTNQLELRPTRTIVYSNLDPYLSKEELERFFKPYGFLVDIETKFPLDSSAYAFIKFANPDMAAKAKKALDGRRLGSRACSLAYAKPEPSKCLWIGGLGPWITYRKFASILNGCNAPVSIVWNDESDYAYILYKSQDDATNSLNRLHDRLITSNHYLRADYCEEDFISKDPQLELVTKNESKCEALPEKAFDARQLIATRKRDAAQHSESNDKSRSYRSSAANGSSNQHREQSISPEPFSPTIGTKDASRKRTHSSPSKSSDAKREKRPHRTSISELALDVLRRGSFYMKRCAFDFQMHFIKHSANKNLEEVKAMVNELLPQQVAKPVVDADIKEVPQEQAVEDTDSLPSPGSKVDLGLDEKQSADATYQDLPTPKEKSDHAAVEENGSSEILLKINQRMKLESKKLDDLARRMRDPDVKSCVLLVTQPNLQDEAIANNHGHCYAKRTLEFLVSYLVSKNAAGVMFLPQDVEYQGNQTLPDSTTTMVYAFPPCNFAYTLLFDDKKSASTTELSRFTQDRNFLLVVFIKNITHSS